MYEEWENKAVGKYDHIWIPNPTMRYGTDVKYLKKFKQL